MRRSLGEVCRFVNGKAFTDTDWSSSGYPIIRIQNLNDHKKPFNYWDGSLDHQILVKNGDLLLAWSGTPGTSFGAHIWNRQDGVLNQHIFKVEIDEEHASIEYLLHAINFGLKSLISAAQGAVGLRHVTKGQVESLKISLPDLPTQRRFAARLKEQLATVEHARQAAEVQSHTSGKLLEKFLVAAFHGICPLSLGINQSNAPNGWAWKKLPSLARLESGHTPSRRCPEYWANGDVPWLALPDIRALDCRVANVTSESTNELGLANSSARLLPKDTVALSRTASVGFITIFGRPMATSQDFVNWICGGDLHPKFLLWLLRAARKFILDQSTGAIHKTVYMDVVERFHVCIPNLAEQQNIAAKLDAIFEEVVSLRAAGTAQLAALQKLPAAFLREAFGGLS